MRRRNFVDALLFIFSPVHNPFFAVMWRQQRRNMGQFNFHLGLMLGLILLVFVSAAFLMELVNFPPHKRGIVLYELVAWSHLIAAGVYGVNLYRRYHQFWREDTRPQLLLTGVPPLWIALAIPVYLLFIQAYIAVLCLPFYAAAVALSGVSWSTVMLTIVAIVMLVESLPLLSWGSFWLFFVTFRMCIRVGTFALWSNLPLLLTLPVRFYAWSIPVWSFLVFAVPFTFAFTFTQWAWILEPRRYPAQERVADWSSYFFFALAFLFGGLVWAYALPADFERKVASALVALRLLISLPLLSFASTKQETAAYILQGRKLVTTVSVLNFVALALIALAGLSSPVQYSTLVRVLAVSFALGVAHSLATGLGYEWWRKLMRAEKAPVAWWLIFFVWLVSPIALFIKPISFLAGIQGWLVPFCLSPSPFAQQGSAYLPSSIKIFVPTWWAAALVQVAWSGLLWWIERKSVMPQVEPKKEERREWLTVSHPVWGWLARLEEQICERLANPLVNLQLRQQSRFTALKVAMELGVAANILTLSLWLTAIVYPHPDLVNIVNELFARLPSLAGFVAFLAAALTVSTYDQKFVLWLLGQKRVVESFVLAPLTKTQWQLGWWFPRVWLWLKAMMPYAVCLWLGTLLQPDAGKILVALLVTLNLTVAAFAFGLTGLAGSLVKRFEMLSVLLVLVVSLLSPIGFSSLFVIALPSARWQIHALIWLLILAVHGIVAFVSFAIFSRRIVSLRSPGGYEQWLQLAEEKFRQAQRWMV